MAMYRDPSDRRLFVPKKTGWGLNINLAHPAGWWVLIGMTIIPLIVVVGAVLAAAL
jgi:uncharacterized membrane protein